MSSVHSDLAKKIQLPAWSHNFAGKSFERLLNDVGDELHEVFVGPGQSWRRRALSGVDLRRLGTALDVAASVLRDWALKRDQFSQLTETLSLLTPNKDCTKPSHIVAETWITTTKSFSRKSSSLEWQSLNWQLTTPNKCPRLRPQDLGAESWSSQITAEENYKAKVTPQTRLN